MKVRLSGFLRVSWRITLVYALLFSFVLSSLSAALLYGIRFYLNHQAAVYVQSVELRIKHYLEKEPEKAGFYPTEMLQEAVPAGENLTVLVLDQHQRLIGWLGNPNLARSTHPLNVIQYEEHQEQHLVLGTVQVVNEKGNSYYVQVIKDVTQEYEFLKALFALLIWFDALGIVCSLLVGYWMSQRMLRPIDTITRTASQISAQDLNQRIAISGPEDELTRLAATFNAMIERLQTAFEKQDRFVADASHELRTPIAIIKGYANLLDRWGKDDPQVLGEAIAAIKKEADGMEKMLERMLFLARSDKGGQELDRQLFGLNALVEELATESRVISPGHVIKVSAEGPIQIYADRKLLMEALRAIVDNSLKYTPAGGRITIRISQEKQHICIVIDDNGIGIPAEHLPHVFDRFYRVDEARSKEKSGSGLGLSIARRIVEAHGGSISLQSTVGVGTRVEVKIPWPPSP